ELVPASARPYIGGSQTNSFLELVFGYNGFGRITGNETGSVGAGGGGNTGSAWGSTGITRMFEGVSGGMIAWLIPAALLLTVTAWLVLGRHAWATSLRHRPASPAAQANAGMIVFTGWLVVTALVFSFMAGIYHDYYTVALAPAIGGSVAIAGAIAWQYRRLLVARIGMAVAVSASALWAVVLLVRAGGLYSVLGVSVAVVGTLAALALLVVDRLPRLLGRVTLAVALGALLAGPTSYSLQTASTAHTGSIVTAGPVTSTAGPGGGRFAGGGRGFPGGAVQGPGVGQAPTAQAPTGQAPQGFAGRQGGMGGLLDGANVSAAMTSLLEQDAGSYTWVAATVGSQNSASYQLATGDPVMAIGGFNGSDPSPTLAEFQQLVAQHRIHYFIGGGGFGRQNGGADSAAQIASWVEQNFTAQTVGGVTVYDLTRSA
ncbi:MAG TPA: glycosyl transferase, partial [Propionibacteriaceae bacterium]|nr:glycosyl transferase [Propionibacteriaceae bacterium]